jgi:hypothetical protein
VNAGRAGQLPAITNIIGGNSPAPVDVLSAPLTFNVFKDAHALRCWRCTDTPEGIAARLRVLSLRPATTTEEEEEANVAFDDSKC